MPFSPELAEIRFGCGLSPTVAPAQTPAAMLGGVQGADDMARQFPIGGFSLLRARQVKAAELRKKARQPGQEAAMKRKLGGLRQQSVREGNRRYGIALQRWVNTQQGFRERLVSFWGDHFTAKGKVALLRFATAPYVEDAIRPNLSGSFGDLLVAAVTHPLMLHFLDQGRSVGSQSAVAARSEKLRGLNENLAREVLELHSLGVGGPYSQDDVRQLAELFTGLSTSPKDGFRFRPDFAEPGAETVLGMTYGGDPATLASVHDALRDLAVHPATARHIARKLSVHFVSDDPDPGLVSHIEARFSETGGDLMAVYAALVEHPASWAPELANVKPPADFVASACRALAPDAGRIAGMDPPRIRQLFLRPMGLMGQPWHRPGGPDGWAEEDSAWITPQGVSARLRWALSVPRLVRPDLPDPREFVTRAIGGYAGDAEIFAANAAESRADAIGLVLASPAFQRR